MSPTVTATRNTTSNATLTITLNTGYCKTVPGLLKILQVVVGLALFIFIYLYSGTFCTYHLHFFLVVFACLVDSTCLLLACLFSLSNITNTLYEVIYHGVAFLLYFLVMIFYFIKNSKYDRNSEHPYITAGALGVILTILYLVSTILAHRSYRGF